MIDPRQPLNVTLLGCGQIADAHLQEIRKIKRAQIVAVCDIHQDLADQAAARFDVPNAFSDIDQMLAKTTPDVVHITTPAHTHAALAIKLLEAGIHVYVEKPFTLSAPEGMQVMSVVDRTGKMLCLGHDQLYDPVWLQLKARVAAGEIGRVTHIESVLGYPLKGGFGRQVTTNPNHWVRRLPGGLFQNTMQHPLYRITDFLTDENPRIDARWYCSQDRDFPTELTVTLRGKEVTAQLLFATNIQAQRITRVYGDNGAFEFDPDGQTIRRIEQPRLPGAFARLEMPWRQWRESAANLRTNVWRFIKSDIHYFSGMNTLFDRFYQAIQNGTEPPIAYDEIMRITRMMDTIFDSCRQREQLELKDAGQ